MHIQVRFIGNHPVDWDPRVTADPPSRAAQSDEPAASDHESVGTNDNDDSAAPRTDDGIREGFKEYLKATRDESLSRSNDKAVMYSAAQRLNITALLGILEDPSASIGELSVAHMRHFFQLHQLTGTSMANVELFYIDVFASLDSRLTICIHDWLGTSNHARETADRAAQGQVPTWYNDRCFLSGAIDPQGAHIVPVRAIQGDLSLKWSILRFFWPMEDVEKLVMPGNEKRNILPLNAHAHVMWDRSRFALRPIQHPVSPPELGIYIQMVWLRNKDENGSFVKEDWNHAKDGSISDYRREHCPPIHHGDVYELLTADPDNYPLPSAYFLQLQFGIHKILAGIRAAGALRIIFGGDPPADQGPAGYDVDVPSYWQVLLDDALREGVLSEEQVSLWGKAFIREHADAALYLGIDSPGTETSSSP